MNAGSQPKTQTGQANAHVRPTTSKNVKASKTSGVIAGTTAASHGTQSAKAHATTGGQTAAKGEKPGFFKRVENYFRGDQGKVIEPGIRNKEVEAYRTNDAKEVEYNDAIIQDDKDVTLPKKHLK